MLPIYLLRENTDALGFFNKHIILFNIYESNRRYFTPWGDVLMKNERRNLQPKQKETNAAWKIEMPKTKQKWLKNPPAG